jgi:trimethylamine--corrinoid protein Co-methyltransferase
VDWIKAFTRGIEVIDKALALDEVAAVGPGGNYLARKHAKKHFKETWYPDLFERGIHAHWQEKGSKTLTDRASEKVQKILAEYQPTPLPTDIKARLREIVKQAEEK